MGLLWCSYVQSLISLLHAGLNATLSSVDNATYQLSVLHAVANNISRALVLGTIGDDLIEFNEEGFSCPTSSFVDGLIGRSNELLDSLCFTLQRDATSRDQCDW